MSLTATVKPPLLSTAYSLSAQSLLAGVLYENLFDYQTGRYSQTSGATIGYDSMTMEVIFSDAETRDWMAFGLGRHIEVYAPSGLVWEGFVNSMSISMDSVDFSVGPLMDISNNIKVTYVTRSYNTNPPIGGENEETNYAALAESQLRWGTFSEIISGGDGQTAITMNALRNSRLNDSAWPKIDQNLSSSGSGTGSITLECLGYYHYLDRFYFDANTADTGEVNISAKLTDILNDDPDGMFSASNASIEANTLQVPSYDDGSRSGLAVIQELIGLGFSSGQRAMFMVEGQRKVIYKSLELDKAAKYTYSIYDQYPSIATVDGTAIEPWDVKPGEWVLIESLLTSKPFSATLPRQSDPKYIFIESVTYESPNSLSIKGGMGNTLKERVSLMGLGFASRG